MKKFIAAGNINDYVELHDFLCDEAKTLPRGLFLISGTLTGLKEIPPTIKIEFCNIDDFELKSNTYEEQIRSNAIAQFIKQYDTVCQYCLIFEVSFQIVGGVSIPFDQPVQLESAFIQAIATYKKS